MIKTAGTWIAVNLYADPSWVSVRNPTKTPFTGVRARPLTSPLCNTDLPFSHKFRVTKYWYWRKRKRKRACCCDRRTLWDGTAWQSESYINSRPRSIVMRRLIYCIYIIPKKNNIDSPQGHTFLRARSRCFARGQRFFKIPNPSVTFMYIVRSISRRCPSIVKIEYHSPVDCSYWLFRSYAE